MSCWATATAHSSLRWLMPRAPPHKEYLTVVNNGSNTVSIFLGNGDGTFQARMDLATGAAPSLGTVGDFNGDGNLDLAVGNTVDHTISVLLGKGDGSFQPRVDYPNCGGGRIRTADFNRDGKLDLAVSGCGVNASAVNILLGTVTERSKHRWPMQ